MSAQRGPAGKTGKLVAALLVLGLVGLAAYRIWDYFQPEGPPPSIEAYRKAQSLARPVRPVATRPASARPAVPRVVKAPPKDEIRTDLRAMAGHKGTILAAVFSPDGRMIASGGFDGVVRLCDVESGKQLHAFEGHSDRITCVAFSPDAKRIASGSFDQTVRVWDIQSGEQVAQFDGHQRELVGVAFLPDGKHLVSGSHKNKLFLWDVEQETVVREFPHKEDWLHSMALSPDGTLVATGACSGVARVRVFETQTGRLRTSFELPGIQVGGLAFSPDGARLVATAEKEGRNSVHVCDLATGQDLLPGSATGQDYHATATSSDGRYFAVAAIDRVDLYDLASGRCLLKFCHGIEPHAAAFSPDGRYVLTAGGGLRSGIGYTPCSYAQVRLWDLKAAIESQNAAPSPK